MNTIKCNLKFSSKAYDLTFFQLFGTLHHVKIKYFSIFFKGKIKDLMMRYKKYAVSKFVSLFLLN